LTPLSQVIKRIYELSWEQFSDLPRGHHKNNSMHKLASKTMIEILPQKLISYIESKCGSLATTPGDHGCQMVIFQTKNPNLCKLWRV
jgi:hypothetical protein